MIFNKTLTCDITCTCKNVITLLKKYSWLYVRSYEYVVYHLLATTVMFSEIFYSVSEDSGSVQPVLVLSNSSSNDITVEVLNIDGLAFGEQSSTTINY